MSKNIAPAPDRIEVLQKNLDALDAEATAKRAALDAEIREICAARAPLNHLRQDREQLAQRIELTRKTVALQKGALAEFERWVVASTKSFDGQSIIRADYVGNLHPNALPCAATTPILERWLVSAERELAALDQRIEALAERTP